MMTYYDVDHVLTVNNEVCGKEWGRAMMDSAECPGKETQCFKGWDWLRLMAEEKHLPSKGTCNYGTEGIFKKRNVLYGYNVSDHCWGFRFTIDPTDNIVVSTTWTERPASLQDIMKWHEGEKAIQWLKDRGLSVCPMTK